VGAPLSQTLWRHFIEEIPVGAADVEVIDLTGMPMKELRRRVAALPDGTVSHKRTSAAAANRFVWCHRTKPLAR
jgi:hypothetical protein